MTNDEKQVRGVIQAINDAWRNDRVDEMKQHIHPDMVIAELGGKRLTEGREACVDSYRPFAKPGVVHKYEEHPPNVDVVGDTAVAAYTFDITYEINGKVHSESGRDLFVLSRVDEKWLAVWRTMMSE